MSVALKPKTILGEDAKLCDGIVQEPAHPGIARFLLKTAQKAIGMNPGRRSLPIELDWKS